jgi:hypothetical protein
MTHPIAGGATNRGGFIDLSERRLITCFNRLGHDL